MLAEVRLIIAEKEARLYYKRGETLVEDDVWRFGKRISATEATSLALVAFHDAYDLLQYTVHED